MLKTRITQKDIQRQDKGLRLLIEGGATVEKPSANRIILRFRNKTKPLEVEKISKGFIFWHSDEEKI